ncbi:MAG: alpha/beta hydrolase [Actinomycetota bacterium]
MGARSIVFESDGLRIEGHLVEPESYDWAIILCHGIPGGPPDPNDEGYARLARTLAERGYAAMWFDFRGARNSPGDFSIAGWCRDLSAAIDAMWVHVRAPLAVVGSSAGGSTALRVAAERKEIDAVATFAAVGAFGLQSEEDARAVVNRFRNIGIIRDPAFPRDLDGWAKEFSDVAPLAAVRKIAPRPLLIVHGDADDVVPYAQAEMLFEKAGEPKELVRIPGGGHQLRKDPRAVDALVDWLSNRSERPSRPD